MRGRSPSISLFELTELIEVPFIYLFLHDHTVLTVQSHRAVLRLREALEDSHFFQHKLHSSFMSQSEQSPPSSSSSSLLLSFPQKLYMILENEVLYNNIIAWNKNGTSFQIRNNNRFEEEVIPRYFKR